MLRKIKVYGRLAKFLGWRTYYADVRSTAEIGRFLKANWPEVEKHMKDQYYKITTSGYDIGQDELNDPIGQEISIVPVAIGASGVWKAIKKVVIGVALVAVTVATGGFGGAAIGTFGIGAGAIGVGTIVAGIGVSLALSGVMEMLSPQPEIPEIKGGDDLDPQSNYSFGGVQNVSRSGVCVSLIYGEMMTGSVVVNNGIDTAQVVGTA